MENVFSWWNPAAVRINKRGRTSSTRSDFRSPERKQAWRSRIHQSWTPQADRLCRLQYAAFRGFYAVCKLLIERGADVNAKTHDQGYSALIFAAISNHKSVVALLLAHEADIDYTNMIGRNASQMAAFVSSYEVNCFLLLHFFWNLIFVCDELKKQKSK